MKICALAAIAKPKGMSSSDVVVKCRGALSHACGERQKCGHMGTLDPMADGVLVLGFGKATRLFDLLLDKSKEYRATVEFGCITDTLDAEGAVTDRTDVLPTKGALIDTMKNFIGAIEQIPPKYSALNIEGRRAYDLARRGAHFVVPKRQVKIFSIEPRSFDMDGDSVKSMTFDVVCGSGTYIRSLCRDIALSVGTLGFMTALTRTRSGNFSLDDCTPLDEFLADPTAHLTDVSTALDSLMPRAEVDENSAFKLLNGRAVDLDADGDVAVFCCKLLGVARKNDDGYKLYIRLCD